MESVAGLFFLEEVVGGAVEHGHVHEGEDMGSRFFKQVSERVFNHRWHPHWHRHSSYRCLLFARHFSQNSISSPVLHISKAIVRIECVFLHFWVHVVVLNGRVLLGGE